MEDVFVQLMQAIGQQTGLGGWAAVVGSFGVALTFGVRIFKMVVPGKFEALKLWVQIAIIFGLAAIGTFGVALAAQLATGVPIAPIVGQLVIAAIGAGITAIMAHHATKPVGKSVDKMLAEKYPNSEPSTLRKASSILIDLPKPTTKPPA